jgi:hypothetical protein
MSHSESGAEPRLKYHLGLRRYHARSACICGQLPRQPVTAFRSIKIKHLTPHPFAGSGKLQPEFSHATTNSDSRNTSTATRQETPERRSSPAPIEEPREPGLRKTAAPPPQKEISPSGSHNSQKTNDPYTKPSHSKATESHFKPPGSHLFRPGKWLFVAQATTPFLHTLHNILWTFCRKRCILCPCYFTFI